MHASCVLVATFSCLVLQNLSVMVTSETGMGSIFSRLACPFAGMSQILKKKLTYKFLTDGAFIRLLFSDHWELGNPQIGTSIGNQGNLFFLCGSLDRKSTRLNSSHVKISY